MSRPVTNIARGLDYVYYGLLLQVIIIFAPAIAGFAFAIGGIDPLRSVSILAYIGYGIFGGMIFSNFVIIAAKYACMISSNQIPDAPTNAIRSLFLQVASFSIGMILSGFDSWIFPLILKSGLNSPIVLLSAKATINTILGWTQTILNVFSVLSFVFFLRNVSDFIGYHEGSQKAAALRTRVINLLILSGTIVALSVLMLLGLFFPDLLSVILFPLGFAIPVLVIGVAILGLLAFFSYARLILNVAAKVRTFNPLEASASIPDDRLPKAVIAKL